MMNVYNTHTITVIRQTSDKWGDTASESSSEYRARYAGSNRLITNAEGQNVVSSGFLDVAANVDVQLGDRVLVDGLERQLISIVPQMGFKLEGYRIYLA